MFLHVYRRVDVWLAYRRGLRPLHGAPERVFFECSPHHDLGASTTWRDLACFNNDGWIKFTIVNWHASPSS